MLVFLMPAEVRRNFMMPLLDDVMGAERLLQPHSRETEAERPQNVTTAFLPAFWSSALAVSLAYKGLPLPHCMQDILPSYKAKNFSYLALFAMHHYRSAFQNGLLV